MMWMIWLINQTKDMFTCVHYVYKFVHAFILIYWPLKCNSLELFVRDYLLLICKTSGTFKTVPTYRNPFCGINFRNSILAFLLKLNENKKYGQCHLKIYLKTTKKYFLIKETQTQNISAHNLHIDRLSGNCSAA